MFSGYATHVTPIGTKLINKGGTILAGPYFDEGMFKNGLVELSRRSGHALVSSIAHLKLRDLETLNVYIRFMEHYGKVFNIPKSQIIIPSKKLELP